jgi:hypothetical protein
VEFPSPYEKGERIRGVIVREISREKKKHFYLPRKSAKLNGYNRINLGGGRGGTEH